MPKVELKPGEIVVWIGWCSYCGRRWPQCECGKPNWNLSKGVDPDEPDTETE